MEILKEKPSVVFSPFAWTQSDGGGGGRQDEGDRCLKCKRKQGERGNVN